ncbi:hypothetical protein [Streptacidiphilus sp. MAP5-52]|uniref:hypothetical protein n=1 Tax=Streptacidiphilus sp. MAP5-52 TaxID=3156267 RepID=UPI003515D7C2
MIRDLVEDMLSFYYSLSAQYRAPRTRIVGCAVLAPVLVATALASHFGLLAAAVVAVLAYAAAVAVAVRVARVSTVALVLVSVWALYATGARITGFALRLFGVGES